MTSAGLFVEMQVIPQKSKKHKAVKWSVLHYNFYLIHTLFEEILTQNSHIYTLCFESFNSKSMKKSVDSHSNLYRSNSKYFKE